MSLKPAQTNPGMAYLTALHREYEAFIQDISRMVPVIRVDWSEFRDPEETATRIEREYLEGNFLREVAWRPTRG